MNELDQVDYKDHNIYKFHNHFLLENHMGKVVLIFDKTWADNHYFDLTVFVDPDPDILLKKYENSYQPCQQNEKPLTNHESMER